MTTCEEIEKDKLFNQFKEEAKTALEAFGIYRWQYDEQEEWYEKAELKNAIAFIQQFEICSFTINDLLKEIFEQCDGKNNGNAKLITIECMSEIIAHWETEAYLNEFETAN